MNETTSVDVLVVGAGPTGLMLASSLHAFGVRIRIVDRLIDRAHESRALVMHARSLEIMRDLGVVETLRRRGNTSTRIVVHLSATKRFVIPFDDIGPVDSEFPLILLVSQAETEAVLGDHLASVGQRVDRGVEVSSLVPDETGVQCRLRHLDGGEERLRATFVENLRFAAAILAGEGIKLLIEPINTRDIPGFFLNHTQAALDVIKDVGSSNLYLQYDI